MRSEILKLSNEEQLTVNLERLRNILSSNGLPVVDPAFQSLQKFSELNEAAQRKILANMQTYLRVISQEIELKKDKADKIKVEVTRLKKALREFGLKLLNDDILGLIDENDIIEIYNDEGTQLYRNSVFCKTCSYSLLDLAVNSWDELYDKPSTAKDAALSIVSNTLLTATRAVPYNLGSFVQKEKYMYAKNLRTFMLTLKYITPVVEIGTNRRAGVISTCEASIIAEGVDSVKFKIL
jgi:hypothetical protein